MSGECIRMYQMLTFQKLKQMRLEVYNRQTGLNIIKMKYVSNFKFSIGTFKLPLKE